jgi:hypothetical protein
MVQRRDVLKLVSGLIGVTGTVLTLFEHSRHPLQSVDWLKRTRGFWDIATGWIGADLVANLKDGLTLSIFLIVTALAMKRGLPFQERMPRMLSMSFLESFILYMLLTALFVAIPFDRHSDQFDSASAVQFFLLLPVFAFCVAYASRRVFFGLLWVAFAWVGVLWFITT